MRFNYTVGGGTGDYILRYLGFPGDRLSHIQKVCPNEIQLLVSDAKHPGVDLLIGNPFFKDALTYNEKDAREWPSDQIDAIRDIRLFPKSSPRVWLEEHEEKTLQTIKKPYAVFHPFAGCGSRSLTSAFDTHELSQWLADVAGMPVVVLGNEDFGYKSENVFQIKCSVRLSVKIVEGASFFVGTHSSMQCAAWVYDIPSFCLGPSQLLFHNIRAPKGHETYLRPLFANNNIFMMYEQGLRFPHFFDYFLRAATSIRPLKNPGECRRRVSLLNTALAHQPFLGKTPY